MSRRCPICKRTESTPLKRIRMEMPDYVDLPKNYEIVVCDKCGFTYANIGGGGDAEKL